ncbi:ADP-ribosyltransferase [Nonomuraea sp. NPDC049480]|uniref:ADP-ribosyltransferase n=1 Tax=Nonomuraea sp. NPDC049480 TaxID=3364353 RepID=UPI0037A89C35
MGFDGFLVPDWAKPYVGYAVGMDWPEGDEDGCFRLADACAAGARAVGAQAGLAGIVKLESGSEDWDGDALKAFVEYARSVADPALAKLVEELVSAAINFNELGVQVEYTKRMIEVSVWFLIFQVGWLLAMAFGPWGALSFALIGSRVQLTRLVIAQLGKRLLINVGLFGTLLAGMDLAVQASQARRDHLDWEQIMTSAGTGALLGGFLTVFTGLWPARSMWGLMARSGLASGATDLSLQLASGQPLDGERLLKNVTSGILGGADAHWASWAPGVHHIDGPTTLNGASDRGHGSSGHGYSSSGNGHGSSYGDASHSSVTPEFTSLSSAAPTHTTQHAGPSGAMAEPTFKVGPGTDGTSGQHVTNRLPPDTLAQANGGGTAFAGVGSKQDVIPAKLDRSVDSLINRTATADAPSASRPGESGLSASAKPEGLGPSTLAAQATPFATPQHATGPGAAPPGPFQILADPGKSGDGYVASGHWGKYGAAGVLIQAIDTSGQPRYLLMQQSQYVSNAGKWQLPGGALDSLETPVQGAARELSEELGVDQAYLNTLELSGALPVEAAKGWTYTNLAAKGEMFTPKLDTFETSGAKWFKLDELAAMANNKQLHPALAKALPDLLGLFHQDTRADAAAPAKTARALPDHGTTSNAAPIHHYPSTGMASRIAPPVDFSSSKLPPAGHLIVPGNPDPVPVPPKPDHAPAFPKTPDLLTPPPKPANPPLPFSGLTANVAKSLAADTIHRTDSNLFYTAPAPHVPMDAPFGARLVGTSFGDAIWGPVIKTLPDNEVRAVRHYSDHGFRDINDFLRARGDALPSGWSTVKNYYMNPGLLANIERLNHALSRQPVPETIDVFRAVDLTDDLFTVPMEELPGTVQRDPAFMSTNIGRSAIWSREVILHLRVPEGTPALYVDPISEHGGERELLLGTGRSWFAEDVRLKNGRWHVFGWILPEGSE